MALDCGPQLIHSPTYTLGPFCLLAHGGVRIATVRNKEPPHRAEQSRALSRLEGSLLAGRASCLAGLIDLIIIFMLEQFAAIQKQLARKGSPCWHQQGSPLACLLIQMQSF